MQRKCTGRLCPTQEGSNGNFTAVTFVKPCQRLQKVMMSASVTASPTRKVWPWDRKKPCFEMADDNQMLELGSSACLVTCGRSRCRPPPEDPENEAMQISGWLLSQLGCMTVRYALFCESSISFFG